MERPINKIKDKLYRGRLRKYYEAGKLYESFSNSKLEQIAKTLSLSTRRYFNETLDKPNIRAYHDVQGQLTLIDADVFGLIEDRYQENDLDCAFNVGQFFYDIKLVDSFIDNKIDIPLEDKINFLDLAEKSLLGEKVYSSKNGEFNSILEILSAYVIKDTNKIISTNGRLKNNVIRSLTQIPNKDRLQATIEIGADMGNIMYKIMKQNYIKMPEWAEQFLIQQGKTANIFDDIKDFSIDRKRKQGYSYSFFQNLLTNLCYNYVKINTKLPTKESLKRFYTFVVLGSIFQLEELFKLKSRS